MAATSASVFRNLDCLSLFAYIVKQIQLCWHLKRLLFCFFFLKNLRFQIGSAAYLRMRLIHGRLQYSFSDERIVYRSFLKIKLSVSVSYAVDKLHAHAALCEEYVQHVRLLAVICGCGRARSFLRLLADRILNSLRFKLLALKAQFNFFLPLACSCGARTSCTTSCMCIIFGLYCNHLISWINNQLRFKFLFC